VYGTPCYAHAGELGIPCTLLGGRNCCQCLFPCLECCSITSIRECPRCFGGNI
ncbi:hypothetical protein FRC10_003655, partial [Ceratobasidium sp. 414]